MRTILMAIAAVAAIGIVGATSISAAPINGAIIDNAANTSPLSEQVDCRWYPHRHRGGVPHGFSRGCAKGQRPGSKKKA